MHSSLLRLAPYYALWYPGPLAKEFRAKEMRPRYKHDAAKLSLRTRGIDLNNNRFLILQVGADHPCRRPAAAPSRAAAREHGAVGFRP